MAPPIEKEFEDKVKEAKALQEELEAELSKEVLPALEDADRAIDLLEMRDMAELKAIKKPEEQVLKVMKTLVAVLYNMDDASHDDWRKKASSYLVEDMRRFDRDDPAIANVALDKINAHFLDEQVSVENMEKFTGPRIAKVITKWLFAMQVYIKKFCDIKPRRDKLKTLHEELEKLHKLKDEAAKSKASK
mmetsp:Transcript_46430/g.86790  ORF Transcript_46430/g.86790 Transcript_46430/m.86790 type:complete len:190 (+) Transcript_46430:53-622(+)